MPVFKESGHEYQISSMCVFRKGVLPIWEDEINENGSELRVSFFDYQISLEELGKLWEETVFKIISHELIGEQIITGARVVDKSIGGKSKYRIEVWYE